MEQAPAVGELVAHRFRLVRLLSEGGQGEVYLAEDTKTGNARRAIKVLRPDDQKDRAAVRRFVREAHVLDALQGDPAVPVFLDLCTEEERRRGLLYYVMDLTDGETLAEHLNERGPLAPGRALALLVPVARAVDRLHRRGVVHRDLKPSNLWLQVDDTVRVLDFGLATTDDPHAAGPATTPMDVKVAGWGTRPYMAPEQMRGGGDHRVDVFALGVVLYEVLTNALPFGPEGIDRARDPGGPSDPAGVPESIVRAVRKALAWAPEDRHQSAAELAEELSGRPSRPRATRLIAVPHYIPGQKFVGREAELKQLDDWLKGHLDTREGRANVLVLEALGGTGKSALAWHWTLEHAALALPALDQMLWFSFYEQGADMASFVRYAWTAATGDEAGLQGRTTEALTRDLPGQLRRRPMLIVLDGLERLLVAYNRADPAHDLDAPPETRDDRLCVRWQDGELLRQLSDCGPSRVLVTSRLVPADLTNRAGQCVPGVRFVHLAGLGPDDALALVRAAGVRGQAEAIRRYLSANFGNHPLVITVWAGLLNHYYCDPGDFDVWVNDPEGGGALRLSKLDLRQRRTHILAAALNALPSNRRRLLVRLAQLSYVVERKTVEALSPFDATESTSRLRSALLDLRQRGLLHWDRAPGGGFYDMHPVVRGYARDLADAEERAAICGELADHFDRLPADRYDQAATLMDLRQSIELFRMLAQSRQFDRAAQLYRKGLNDALLYGVEAPHVAVALLKELFVGCGFLSACCRASRQHHGYLLNAAALASYGLGNLGSAQDILVSELEVELEASNVAGVLTCLTNLGHIAHDRNQLALEYAAFGLGLQLARAYLDTDRIAQAQLNLVVAELTRGRIKKARAAYAVLKEMGTPASRALYRPGMAELLHCWIEFRRGKLTTGALESAMNVARSANNRAICRSLWLLRGELAIQSGEAGEAVIGFQSALTMERESGVQGDTTVARLALALALDGDVAAAHRALDEASEGQGAAQLPLAEAHLTLGNRELAREHVLEGYRWAWADGPPHVHAWELRRCKAVLKELGHPEPTLKSVQDRFDVPLAEAIRLMVRRGEAFLRPVYPEPQRRCVPALERLINAGFGSWFKDDGGVFQLLSMREDVHPFHAPDREASVVVSPSSDNWLPAPSLGQAVPTPTSGFPATGRAAPLPRSGRRPDLSQPSRGTSRSTPATRKSSRGKRRGKRR